MYLRRPWGGFGSTAPWREMERLRREMDRIVSNVGTATGAAAPGYPALNVWTNEDGAIVTAELPGVSAEDIEISVVDDTLTLSGARKANDLKEGEVYHRRERGSGKFARALQLPFPVQATKVEAVFDKGVLSISLPRLEADKPRKITVKAA